MTSGMVAGYFLRNIKWVSKPVGIIITWAIYLLLFLLGISVGSNETIISNIGKIGMQSLLLTAGAVSGSVFFSWIIYKLFFLKHEE
jgi:uncharacterized membrane protein YbjE (DUF340 family)